MYYSRHIEPVIERIARRKPVLVLTGARQVGKSTMLKEVYSHLNYVALNRPLVRQSATENPSLFFEANKPPVIVDEIQKAAELFDYIKDIVDENKTKGQFYLTGSQSMKLMKNVSDSLAGRAGIVRLLGLSMRELDGVKHRSPFVPSMEHLQAMKESQANISTKSSNIYYHEGAQTLPYPLNVEEEAKAIESLCNNNSKESRELLIERNLRLVAYSAKKFEDSGAGIEDLIAIGTIGLIKAVNNFDCEANKDFASYIIGCIESEIIAYLHKILPDYNWVEGVQKSNEYTRIIGRIHKGFFPELYETDYSRIEYADYYSSYFQTYIEKDIKDVLQIQDEAAFIKFVKAIAALTGQELNYNALAEICGKDNKTVKAWLSVMESSGLVYLLEPYYNNFNKRLIKSPKLYFLDTGLACWLLGWNTPEQLANGAMWGHIFESFVFAEILKSYYNDGIVKPPLFYYRDKDKNEIDLLIKDGDTLYPVEIKTTSDPVKSMVKSFRCVANIPNKKVGTGAVVCLAKEALPLTDGVWIWPVGLV